MSKIIVIGDIHGRNIWEQIVDQDFDKLIFLGDYFDSFDISIQDQIENYEKIMHFKFSNRDRVVCLLGNHDFQYLPYVDETYSGYSPITKMHIGKSLSKFIDMGYIELAHTDGDYLFSHAGISKTWLNSRDVSLLNKHFRGHSFMYEKLSNEPYGNDKREGPLRIRPKALHSDLIEGYTQVHGHTQVGFHGMTLDEKTINCDALRLGEYLEITDGKPLIRLV